jgi:hypothetical protein
VALSISLSSRGTSTGSAFVGSLPYNASTHNHQPLAVGFQFGVNTTNVMQAYVLPGDNQLQLGLGTPTGSAGVTDTQVTQTASFNIGGTYISST